MSSYIYRKIAMSCLTLAAGLSQWGCGKPAEPGADQRNVAARVLSLDYEAVPAAVEAPGSVQPRDRITLAAQINGFVRTLSVRAGDMVGAGQVLATLDARDAESQKAAAQAGIEEATASLEEARKGVEIAGSMRAAAKAADDLAAATLRRFQTLLEAKSVSPQEFDEVRSRREAAAADLAAKETMISAAQARLKQAQARISQAQAQSSRADVAVGWSVLKAPSAGRIVERLVDPGAAIFPGTPILIIESGSIPQVLAEIPTEHLTHLRRGMEVTVKVSEGEAPVRGKVTEIAPQADPARHTVRFKVDLPAGFSAPSGSFARIHIPAGTRKALLTTRGSIRETGQLTGLFVVDGASRARFRLVKVTPFDADRFELLAGIEAGERIVAALTDEILDGVHVESRQ